MPASRLPGLWQSLFRFAVGCYWLYFAASKWAGIDWIRPLIQGMPQTNPIPGLRQMLAALVVPHWQFFAVTQTAGETVVGILLIAGLATRLAGIGATLLATGLALTIGFGVTYMGFQWLYYLAVLVSAQVVAAGPGSVALDRFRLVPAWARLSG